MFFSALSESLWTKTLKELIKYTTKAPYTYLSGLLILSEMLPLPLPIQTREVRGKGRSREYNQPNVHLRLLSLSGEYNTQLCFISNPPLWVLKG